VPNGRVVVGKVRESKRLEDGGVDASIIFKTS